MNTIPFEKSFASHIKAKFWSSRNTGVPADYALNSHKKIWFDCDCGHSFESTLLNINKGNNWCPYCYNRKLCGNCSTCFEKSFASHEKAKYWSNKNELKPIEVLKGSEKKYYFNCDKCFHLLLIDLKHISSYGRWCPYCAHQKLCDDLECKMCFKHSFASIEQSQFWSSKNIEVPRNVFKSSGKKFLFNCNKCNNEIEKRISDITNAKSWCPLCYNKTEKKLYEIMKLIYPNLQSQYKVKWCKNKTYLPFDFVLVSEKIIVELDGKQHFKQVHTWASPEENFKNDIYKMKCANENGFSVIRILQSDVLTDKYDWLNELTNNINKIILENKVQNIYMCKNDEYKDFDNKLI